MNKLREKISENATTIAILAIITFIIICYIACAPDSSSDLNLRESSAPLRI